MILVQVERKRETSEIHGTNTNKRVTIINSKNQVGVIRWEFPLVRSFIIDLENVTWPLDKKTWSFAWQAMIQVH